MERLRTNVLEVAEKVSSLDEVGVSGAGLQWLDASSFVLGVVQWVVGVSSLVAELTVVLGA